MGTAGATPASVLDDDVRAVAAHLGVAEADVLPAPVQGQVNHTVFLGSELVLRIPRSSRAAERLATEAEVMGLVKDAGVPTPELVGYDVSGRVARSPYMLLQRVPGTTLADRAPSSAARRRTLASLGEVLVTLHRIRRADVGPVPAIPEPFTFSPPELLAELREAGEIGAGQHDWLLERFDLLQPDGPSLADPVLLHRDVIGSNVMVGDDGRVTALLDWGCAEWGSPGRDLVGLPVRDLPDLLAGYRSALGPAAPSDAQDGDRELERGALWFHLYLALARLLKRPSTSEDRNWAAPRSATLLDLFAFVTGADTAPWLDSLRRCD